MSNIIELCGPSGVGKTAIYNQLKLAWRKDDRWIPASFLYPRQQILFGNPYLFFKSLGRRIGGAKDIGKMKKAGDLFISENQQFFDLFWTSSAFRPAPSFNSTDVRFSVANYVFENIQKTALIRENQCMKSAVLDEGLLQCLQSGWHKLTNAADSSNEIKAFMKVLPLPHAVIFVGTSVAENVQRLLTREKCIAAHRNLSKQQLDQIVTVFHNNWAEVLKELSDRNIPLLQIDSTLSVETNVRLMKNFLHEVDPRKRTEIRQENKFLPMSIC